MKYIVVGLGKFGAELAIRLTQQGNEVIGIDNNMGKVDELKDRISHTICLDAKDSYTVGGLPLKDADIVIVAIGEDEGANIMATAVLKNLNVKRLVSRAINPLHETVLKAIGVDEIVNPEAETAERWAKKLCHRGVVDSFELDDDYSIVEIRTPEKYIGKALSEIRFRENYNLVVLTTIKTTCEKNSLGVDQNYNKVQGVASPDTVLNAGDIMVVYGSNKDLKFILKV